MAEGQRRTLLGVAIGHAAHDTWYGVAPILLATLSGSMQLSNSEIGLVLLLYQTVSSLTQPFFGRLSETVGGRPLAVGAILWTSLSFTGAVFSGSKAILAVCIGLAGLGSGAWHPQGSANATAAGGARWGATSASLFFLGGSMGSAFLGAALGGYLLEVWGRASLLVLTAVTVLLAVWVVRRLVPHHVVAPVARGRVASRPNGGGAARAFWLILIFLLLSTALRSLSMHTLNTYVPKYQEDLGVSSAVYGLVMSFFIAATAVGGVAGSYLADRVGTRAAGTPRVLVGSMILTALLLVPFVRLSGTASYVALIAAGLALGPSHTLLVVAGQRMFPQRVAMVSGIFLGFNFASGAGGAWVFGLLADQYGLGRMLSYLPWALAGASVFALLSVARTRLDHAEAAAS